MTIYLHKYAASRGRIEIATATIREKGYAPGTAIVRLSDMPYRSAEHRRTEYSLTEEDARKNAALWIAKALAKARAEVARLEALDAQSLPLINQ